MSERDPHPTGIESDEGADGSRPTASRAIDDPAASPAGPEPAAATLTPFLNSLQLADSFFPSGLFTLSHGLESYAQAKLLTASSLAQLTGELLLHSVGPTDATALALTHRAAATADLTAIAAIDRRLTAVKVAREPRQASIRLGRQLLALARDVFDVALAGQYLSLVRERDLPGNQAVALGLLKAGLAIPVADAVAGELYSFAASCAGAGLRMALIDHRQAQRIVRHVQPAIVAATAAALTRELAMMSGSAPFAELMSMTHETADIRLFVT